MDTLVLLHVFRDVIAETIVVAGEHRDAAGVEKIAEDGFELVVLGAGAVFGDIAGDEDVADFECANTVAYRFEDAQVMGGLADVEVGDVGEGHHDLG